jgi:glycosyltransferase involved in cell wall biosynthesis
MIGAGPSVFPLVSVVMPCLNSAATVAASLASALAQTMREIELIVVDNGSTDRTVAIVEAIGDPRVRVLHQPVPGVSAARNLAIGEARAELIAFLDSDDSWTPAFLERMYDALGTHPDAVLAYCGWQNLGLAGGRGDPFVPPDYEHPDKIERLLGGCRWPIHAALTRRRSIVEAGSFDQNIAYAEDFALWLRVASFAPIIRVPEVLAFYHHHDAPRASNDPVRAARQLHAVQREFLRSHPEIRRRLGRRAVRRTVEGELLHRGMEAYWARNLEAAHAIFRMVLSTGYLTLTEVRYVLPAILPCHAFRTLVSRFEDVRAAHGPTQT